MNRLSLLGFSVCVAAALGSAACGTACKTVDSTPLTYDNGNDVAQNPLFYITTDWHGTWLDFPGGREYQLIHHLQKDTQLVPTPYVAFSPQPMPENGVGNASVSPGNQSIIQGETDTYVQVRNDTCEHFYLLMTIQAYPKVDAGAADSGAQAGTAGAAGATN
ncbi:MAG TPA: hypothetical protein VGM29_01570 [Polyangiaceae bacterium]